MKQDDYIPRLNGVLGLDYEESRDYFMIGLDDRRDNLSQLRRLHMVDDAGLVYEPEPHLDAYPSQQSDPGLWDGGMKRRTDGS